MCGCDRYWFRVEVRSKLHWCVRGVVMRESGECGAAGVTVVGVGEMTGRVKVQVLLWCGLGIGRTNVYE